MTKDDLKTLEKLAKLCRKVGIKTFRNESVEFTLSESEPIAIRKSRTEKKESPKYAELEQAIQERVLTEEEMLFWSSTAVGETEPQPN